MSADVFPLPVPTLDRLERLGVDVARVFREAKLAPSLRAEPRATLTTRDYFALSRAIEAVSGRRDLGLVLAEARTPADLSLCSRVALQSETVREALEKVARYKRLVCPEAVTLARKNDEAIVRLEWLLAEEEPPALLVDLIFAGMVTLVRSGNSADRFPETLRPPVAS